MYIIIFGGTTEGRLISERLCEKGIYHTVCVATKSGEEVLRASDFARINTGRMGREEMKAFIEERMKIKRVIIVDATHPYATEVTENIKSVCAELEAEYVRIRRGSEDRETVISKDREAYVSYYDDIRECLQALKYEHGNILLTTGSKDLVKIDNDSSILNRLYVRVLPNTDSYELCRKAGIDEKRIIAMYGPHSEELNRAVLKQFDIKHMVTKESGKTGGYEEKINAAVIEGCSIHIIKRPYDKEGLCLDDFIRNLDKISDADKDIPDSIGYEKDFAKGEVDAKAKDKQTTDIIVSLIGIGMDGYRYITLEGKEAIDKADHILGAGRMIEAYVNTHHTEAIYTADRIIPFLNYLKDSDKDTERVAILFSGDTGIYSGASKLYNELAKWGKCKKISIIPGISSFSAFAAILGRQYTGVRLESLHGKSDDVNVVNRIKGYLAAGEELYILMSGKDDFTILSKIIPSVRRLDVGYNLSYPDQKIIHTDSEELMNDISECKEGLYIVRVESKGKESGV